MNAMERVLSDDLSRLIDRLAGSIPEGAYERIRTTAPAVAARLDDLEVMVGNARAALVEDYTRWARALDDLENAWSVAAWRADAETPVAAAARLAA
jgi:hypothetical protein